MNGQYDGDKEDTEDESVRTTGGQAAATLSYGIAEKIDLVLSLPYLWGKAEVNEVTLYDEHGIGDAVLETKLRLFEKNGFSMALKPGISFPTGNDENGLGTGQLGSWAFHGNLGYIRNENKVDERKDIWHASLAAIWKAIKNLKLVANVGIECNPDDDANNDPVFLIGGVIYSINENFDVDLGVKCGLRTSETDLSVMAGVTFRF